jgi:hypothetical protein
MRGYTQLTLEQRYQIQALLKTEHPLTGYCQVRSGVCCWLPISAMLEKTDHTEFRVLEIGVFLWESLTEIHATEGGSITVGVSCASSPVIPDILYRESRFAVRSGWIPDYQCRG